MHTIPTSSRRKPQVILSANIGFRQSSSFLNIEQEKLVISLSQPWEGLANVMGLRH